MDLMTAQKKSAEARKAKEDEQKAQKAREAAAAETKQKQDAFNNIFEFSGGDSDDSDDELGLALAMSMSRQGGAALAAGKLDTAEVQTNEEKEGDIGVKSSMDAGAVVVTLDENGMEEEDEAKDDDIDTPQMALSRCVKLFREPLDMSVYGEVSHGVKPFTEVLEDLVKDLRGARN